MRGAQVSHQEVHVPEEFLERWRRLPVSTDLFEPINRRKMDFQDIQRRIVEGLERFGIVFLDASEEDEASCRHMMRATGRFFTSPDAVQRQTLTNNFQGGLTPEGVEQPDREEQAKHRARLAPENYPFPTPYDADPKVRFMCKVGPAPAATRFPGLTPPTKIIPGHEALYAECTAWGTRIFRDGRYLLDRYAAYYGLPIEHFSTNFGAHFVAPTGIDLTRHVPGTVAADVHADMGFCTGHDPSAAYFADTEELRPCGGLVAWSSDGTLFRVVVPKGTRPWQAGFQLRHMTGGKVLAGMHQVIVPPEAAELANEARKRGTRVMRVTGTIFIHGTADERAIVHPKFRKPDVEYEEPWLGELDQRVLDRIFAQNNQR